MTGPSWHRKGSVSTRKELDVVEGRSNVSPVLVDDESKRIISRLHSLLGENTLQQWKSISDSQPLQLNLKTSLPQRPNLRVPGIVCSQNQRVLCVFDDLEYRGDGAMILSKVDPINLVEQYESPLAEESRLRRREPGDLRENLSTPLVRRVDLDKVPASFLCKRFADSSLPNSSRTVE